MKIEMTLPDSYQLPEKWVFTDERCGIKFVKLGGLYLEVRKVHKYFRAELILDGRTRWNCGIWVHEDSEEKAIESVEKLADAAGIVRRHDDKSEERHISNE